MWNVFECVNGDCKATVAFPYKPTSYTPVPSQKDKIGFAKTELLHFKWFTWAKAQKWIVRKPIEDTWVMGDEEKAIMERANSNFDMKNFVIVEHNTDGTVKE